MKLICAIFLIISSFNLYANEKYSMRSCMILPISDDIGSSLAFKVFDNLEGYLKSAGWCDYKSSADVLGIFSKYRNNLESYLEDENVIRTVADRLKVGTLIKVKLKLEVDKVNIHLKIIGENGSDIYFDEKTILNKVDPYDINTALVSWLELYEVSIPYDGKVLGVLGDQLTFTFPKNKKVAIGQEYVIKRFKSKNTHPLLKKIVEWKSETIGKGKIFNLSRGQALGVVKIYNDEKKARTGDWIKLEKYNPEKVHGSKDFSRYEEDKYGRLGDVSIAFSLGSHTVTSKASGDTNKLSGLLYGLKIDGEAWITRQYFVAGEFSKKIGDVDKSEGSPSSSSSSQSPSTLKVLGGLKYLPMGYFYGPQVNFYGGWAKYSFSLDKSSSDGFGANDISGILLGVGGNVPLKKGLRLYASGEIIPISEFNDEDNVFGSTKSISSMALELGVIYRWSPAMKLTGGIDIIENSMKFSGNNSELTYSDTNFNAGVLFSF